MTFSPRIFSTKIIVAFSAIASRSISFCSAMSSSRFRSWPITEAAALEPMLKEMGLRVSAKEIDGTSSGSGNALSDAMVSVGPAGRGGTGSFISSQGLIITNHHVALDAVRQASTQEQDYLKHGFVARSVEEEIAGPDYEVWVTRACTDVSERFLRVRTEMDPLERANAVRDLRQAIAREAEEGFAQAGKPASSFRCEVQEMWPMKSYVLFEYERFRDVRIVYVPPMALGSFGGDTDNFEFPRHTADFTLLRAYVAPDGSAAEPSPDNVPYSPQRFLRASKSGVAEGDFVFLLGFPGHTMRYAPSARLKYSSDIAVPALTSDFGEKLKLIKEHATDRAAALKLAKAKKGLANEYKRSIGKSVMVRKLKLVEERIAEEETLVQAAPAAAPVLERLQEIYADFTASAAASDLLGAMRGAMLGSSLLAVAHALHEASVELAKPDGEREAEFRDRNLPFLVKRLHKRLVDMHPPHEAALLRRAVAAASRGLLAAKSSDGGATAAGSAAPPLLGTLQPSHLEALGAVAEDLQQYAVGGSVVGGQALSIESLSASDLQHLLSPDESCRSPHALANDPAYAVAAALYPAYRADRDDRKRKFSERDQLLAKLLELQEAHAKEEVFYPDANGCLRLSAGNVEGYQAADAVLHSPMTTLAGLLDKHAEAGLSEAPGFDKKSKEDLVQGGEFDCPERLANLCADQPDIARTPVCVCYSTDTVGGNSGSPVLDADGNFVAINFDRQRSGLMNEFKWSHEYSRSIGTDVRYILFLVGHYDGAQWLVDEMVN